LHAVSLPHIRQSFKAKPMMEKSAQAGLGVSIGFA
jgi:hypothetical protein